MLSKLPEIKKFDSNDNPLEKILIGKQLQLMEKNILEKQMP